MLFVECAVGLTSSVVLSLFIHTECIPARRSENIFLGNVVHTNGDSEHRAKGDKVGSDMTVADSAVVCAPVVHNVVSRLECALTASATDLLKFDVLASIMNISTMYFSEFFSQKVGISVLEFRKRAIMEKYLSENG